MKKLEFNFTQYIMLNACISYSNEYKESTDKIVAFSQALAAIDAKVQLITALLASQKENTTGTAQKKKQLKEILAAALLAVSNPVAAYAQSISDPELQKAIRKARTTYMRMKPELLISTAANVISIVTPLLPSIVSTGVTLTSLNAIQTAADNLEPYTGKPRAKTVAKKQDLTSMVKLLAEAMTIIRNQCDPLSTGFLSINEQNYYNGYHYSRKLTPYGTHHTRAEVDAFMGDTNSPVVNALVQIDGTLLKGITNEQGHVSIPYIPFDQDIYATVTSANFPNPVHVGPFRAKKGKSVKVIANFNEFTLPASKNATPKELVKK